MANFVVVLDASVLYGIMKAIRRSIDDNSRSSLRARLRNRPITLVIGRADMTERTARREIEKAKSVLDRAVESEHRARERFEKALTKAAGYGLSQREIASAAGVSQPYVSQVLRRRPRRFVPSSPRGDRLASRRAQVIEVLEGNGLREPAVFGSVARGEDGPDSDIDLLVTIPSDMGLLQLARVEVAIEDVVGCPVDLVPRRLLAAGVRSTVERDEVPL